jgi:hypothetical protein
MPLKNPGPLPSDLVTQITQGLCERALISMRAQSGCLKPTDPVTQVPQMTQREREYAHAGMDAGTLESVNFE